MKTNTKASFARAAACAFAVVAFAGSVTPAHATDLLDSLKQSAAQGERNPHAPTSVAAVRG